MTFVNTLFALCTLFLGIILWITVSGEKRLTLRSLSLVLGIAFLPIMFLAMTELLSRPKPASLEWLKANAAEAKIHGSVSRENEAIYVWLQLDDGEAPRAYSLPWSEAAAIQLHKAKAQADAQGTELRMRIPFKSNQPKVQAQFYAEPQKAAPPKQTDQDNVMQFSGSPPKHH